MFDAAVLSATPAYLLSWFAIWGLGVFAPGWIVVGPFAEHLQPFRDVVAYGGLGGVFEAAPFALLFAGLTLAALFAAWCGATMLGSLLGTTMVALARTGRFKNMASLNGLNCFLVILAGGCAFWFIRIALLILIHDRSAGTMLDAVATVLVIGLCARKLDQLLKRNDGDEHVTATQS